MTVQQALNTKVLSRETAKNLGMRALTHLYELPEEEGLLQKVVDDMENNSVNWALVEESKKTTHGIAINGHAVWRVMPQLRRWRSDG